MPRKIICAFRIAATFAGCILLAACATAPKNITTKDWDLATQQVIKQYGPKSRQHLQAIFDKADVPYPPKRIAFLAFKKERKLELWAKHQRKWRYINTYPIRAKSGHPGPKLKQNDLQIPEGIYKIVYLHPFSQLHLSMKLNYPNNFDRAHAINDGRQRLGDNIFIHGKKVSAGCIAIGDHNIEDMFVLVNDVGPERATVIIAPNDLRYYSPVTRLSQVPEWAPELYRNIKNSLQRFSKS